MKAVERDELMNVIGGRNSVAEKKLDQATELALTKLQSDLKDLAQPQQNQSQQFMTMMMAAMMAKRVG
jgi:hypothetical protein